MADKCAVCHGFDGLRKIAEAPNFAGQNDAILLSSSARSRRESELRNDVGRDQDLSETDIEDLAAYHSAIENSVGTIPEQ